MSTEAQQKEHPYQYISPFAQRQGMDAEPGFWEIFWGMQIPSKFWTTVVECLALATAYFFAPPAMFIVAACVFALYIINQVRIAVGETERFSKLQALADEVYVWREIVRALELQALADSPSEIALKNTNQATGSKLKPFDNAPERASFLRSNKETPYSRKAIAAAFVPFFGKALYQPSTAEEWAQRRITRSYAKENYIDHLILSIRLGTFFLTVYEAFTVGIETFKSQLGFYKDIANTNAAWSKKAQDASNKTGFANDYIKEKTSCQATIHSLRTQAAELLQARRIQILDDKGSINLTTDQLKELYESCTTNRVAPSIESVRSATVTLMEETLEILRNYSELLDTQTLPAEDIRFITSIRSKIREIPSLSITNPDTLTYQELARRLKPISYDMDALINKLPEAAGNLEQLKECANKIKHRYVLCELEVLSKQPKLDIDFTRFSPETRRDFTWQNVVYAAKTYGKYQRGKVYIHTRDAAGDRPSQTPDISSLARV